MKDFLITRWKQISSKAGAIIGVLPALVDLPNWASVLLVILGITFFGADEDKLIAQYRKK